MDASVLVAEERSGGIVESLVGSELAALSVVTVSELLQGVRRASDGRRYRRLAFVESVLKGYVSVPITHYVARVHSIVWAELAGVGQTIGAHDLWIAATALAHGLDIATLDVRHFNRVAGLRVVTP